MKIKTEDLTGAALDWAVAMAAGHKAGDLMRAVMGTYNEPSFNYTPSTNWSQGGPIIEREHIGLDYYPDGGHPDGGAWGATTCEGTVHCLGPTPLIAAMRCFVASRLGDEVEVPGRLLEM